MSNTHELSDCTDMTEEQFKECLGRMDMKVFIEDPTKALIDAGVVLKKGVTFKIVETEAAANALPSNVFPLIRTPKNNEELALDDLDKIAGGTGFMFDYTANVVGTGLAGMENAAANANNGDGNKRFKDLVRSRLGK